MKQVDAKISISQCALMGMLLLSPFTQAENSTDVLWQQHTVELVNELDIARQEVICLSPAVLGFDVGVQHAYKVFSKGKTLTSQVTECHSNNSELGLAISTKLGANEKTLINVYYHPDTLIVDQTTALTAAELQVRVGGEWVDDKLFGGEYVSVSHYTLPSQHMVGNKLFKYEGIGWESENIAYRYYFDHRGAIDIFGKKQPNIILSDIGVDGSDYHRNNDWGMDILKVGPSLGIGGLGAWHNGKLFGTNEFSQLSANIHSGSLVSSVNLSFKDWLVDSEASQLNIAFHIGAHSNMTRVTASSSQAKKSLATGIVKHGVKQFSHTGKNWSYLATWGKQTLADDNLGMAIVFQTNTLQQLTADEANELVVFKPSTKPVYYYFTANWQAEPSGAASLEQFKQYLHQTLAKLESPIRVNPQKTH